MSRVICLILVSCFAQICSADILYDMPPTADLQHTQWVESNTANHSYGGPRTFEAYTFIELENPTIANRVSWYGATYLESGIDPIFVNEVYIVRISDPYSNTRLGDWAFTSYQFNKTATGRILGGYFPEYHFSATLPNVQLPESIWLSIFRVTEYSWDMYFLWETNGQSQNYVCFPSSNNCGDPQLFPLNDAPVVRLEGQIVPEPTLALWVVSATAFVQFCRKKR